MTINAHSPRKNPSFGSVLKVHRLSEDGELSGDKPWGMTWVAWRITLGLGSMVTIPWLGSVVYLPMVIVVVSEMGSFHFQMAVSWLLNAGDPNYLQVLGWSSTCPFWGKPPMFSLPKFLKMDIFHPAFWKPGRRYWLGVIDLHSKMTRKWKFIRT